MGNIFQLELTNLTRELGYLFAEIYIYSFIKIMIYTKYYVRYIRNNAYNWWLELKYRNYIIDLT